MKSKILVVDDDASLTALVRLHLERTGLYEVLEVNRTAQALGAARAFGPDAILLDVFMPGKDGVSLSREMAEDALLQQVPIMFFTAEMLQSEAAHGEIVRGGMLFLAKAADPDVLVAAVARLLQVPQPAAHRTVDAFTQPGVGQA
jgi:DNA-binding response OmpR family regulator